MTYVRPLLEYCTQTWSPSYVTNIVKLEKVQNYFTRRISSISNLSYKQRLQATNVNKCSLICINYHYVKCNLFIYSIDYHYV